MTTTPEPAPDAYTTLRAKILSEAADELDRYIGLQSSNAAPEVEGARLVIRQLRLMAGQTPTCGHVNPDGGQRCGRHQGHFGFHRHVLPGGEEWVSWLADIDGLTTNTAPGAGGGAR